MSHPEAIALGVCIGFILGAILTLALLSIHR
jgi:hypothetical protein